MAPHPNPPSTDAAQGPVAPMNQATLPFGHATAMPAPPGGFEEIVADDAYHKIEGQNAEQATAWFADQANAVLAAIPAQSANDPGRWERMEALRHHLRIHFGVPSAIITAPIPERPTNELNTPPIYFLIQGLTPAQRQAILRQRWLSTPAFTAYFTHLGIEPSTLVGFWTDLQCFGDASPEGIRAAFARVWQGTSVAPGIRGLIERDIQSGGRWRNMSIDQAFNTILASIRVRILPFHSRGGILEPLAVVYCEPPTASVADWTFFQSLVGFQQYGSAFTGHPVHYQRHLRCRICRGADHTMGLCPLPNLPGWHGPTPESDVIRRQLRRNNDIDNQQQANAQNGNGRGSRGGRGGRGTNRGRGRGRGGRGGNPGRGRPN
ncbi:hypothetical protein EVJ58_g10026 [Rhodofomes roseus]|uniref:Uncharacterized protein n=1 Tax=Rhodofomes roseus TaxID=34475 RepID=A0A4Y9XQ39_9APHY|nr:hypothetical protein EVJ58_g10026 [Rhodofomes roseus]